MHIRSMERRVAELEEDAVGRIAHTSSLESRITELEETNMMLRQANLATSATLALLSKAYKTAKALPSNGGY